QGHSKREKMRPRRAVIGRVQALLGGATHPIYKGQSVRRGTDDYEQTACVRLGLCLSVSRCAEFLGNCGRRPRWRWQQLWQPRIAYLFEPALNEHGAACRAGREIFYTA